MPKFGIVLGDPPGFREKEGEGGSKGGLHPPKGPLALPLAGIEGRGERARLPNPVSRLPKPFRSHCFQRGPGSISLSLEMETEAERESYPLKVSLQVAGRAGLRFKNFIPVPGVT